MARVALTYNLIHEQAIGDRPIDCIAELDSHETIDAVKNALESGGHKVLLIEADEKAYTTLKKKRASLDIVFNIAEGVRGESRESHMPAIIEMLGMPHVGSGLLSLAACLDKVHTKKILHFYGIPYPAFEKLKSGNEPLDAQLRFPLIAKLACEGSSMGLSYDSVVDNETDLRKQVTSLLALYSSPVLVEEFIGEREFGIPIIGNDPPVTLPIIEFLFHGEKPITIFAPDHELAVFKQRDYRIPDTNVTNECPAKIPDELKKRLNELALASYRALGCLDWCRLEIRLDRLGKPFVIELNPIAGIDPAYRFAQSSKAAGIGYNQLINMILDSALRRYVIGE